MRIWITKYALTNGIQQREAEPTNSAGMLRYGPGLYVHGEGKDWHKTPEAAVKRAEEMRLRKINSLMKQVEKLTGMTFEAPND